MTLSDQAVKWRIVLLVALLALLGFVLEIGPVGRTFSLVNNGPTIATALTLELTVLGFLAYLALAASAMVGLHVGEPEKVLKEQEEEEEEEIPPLQMAEENAATGEQVRVRTRPELHQLRMLFVALGGYALLKGISLLLMWPAVQRAGLTQGDLARLYQFGFLFIALSWFIMWQFLRWYAAQRRWIRLQEELLGVDVSRIIAVIVLLQPLLYLMNAALRGVLLRGPLSIMAFLLELAIVALAVILFLAQPTKLRQTIIGLSVTGGVIVLLTAAMAIIERTITG